MRRSAYECRMIDRSAGALKWLTDWQSLTAALVFCSITRYPGSPALSATSQMINLLSCLIISSRFSSSFLFSSHLSWFHLSSLRPVSSPVFSFRLSSSDLFSFRLVSTRVPSFGDDMNVLCFCDRMFWPPHPPTRCVLEHSVVSGSSNVPLLHTAYTAHTNTLSLLPW